MDSKRAKNIIPHVAQADAHGGIAPCFDGYCLQPNRFSQELQRAGAIVKKVARKFEPVPVASKHSAFRRVNVRYENVKNATWFEPPRHLGHDFGRFVEMLENVKAGDYVKRFRRKLGVENLSNKDLSACFFFGFFRRFG